MKKFLYVITIAVVAYFAYQFYQKKFNVGLGSVDFNEVVIEKKLEVAKDKSNYFFSRHYKTNNGLGRFGINRIKPWIEVKTNYQFEVPFYVECKNLKFKNVSDSTLTVIVDELTADALQNPEAVNLNVKSGNGWNEKGEHANQYLLDYIPDMCKKIKQTQYTNSDLNTIGMDGWQKDIMNSIVNHPQGISRKELSVKAKLGVKGIVEEFIQGLGLTKKQKINIKIELKKLVIFGKSVNL